MTTERRSEMVDMKIGPQIYHNYVRPHEALKDRTSDAAGIKVEGNDKWMTLIQNAAQPTIFDTRKKQSPT